MEKITLDLGKLIFYITALLNNLVVLIFIDLKFADIFICSYLQFYFFSYNYNMNTITYSYFTTPQNYVEQWP